MSRSACLEALAEGLDVLMRGIAWQPEVKKKTNCTAAARSDITEIQPCKVVPQPPMIEDPKTKGREIAGDAVCGEEGDFFSKWHHGTIVTDARWVVRSIEERLDEIANERLLADVG